MNRNPPPPVLAESIENGNHHQIWQCWCGKRRAWGTTRPEDPERVVLLECRECEELQPHGYLRMKHRNTQSAEEAQA